jgi:hypothetical protein
MRTEVIGHFAPWCSGSQHPEDAVEDTPIVNPSPFTSSASLLGQTGHQLAHKAG